VINLTPPPIAHARVYELLNDGSITSIRAVQPSAFPLQSIENYLNRLSEQEELSSPPSVVQLAAGLRTDNGWMPPSP
jgi:hypothetical protein